MNNTTDRRILWLPIVGGPAVLIGLAAIVLGGILAPGARSDREDAETAVARQQEAVAQAEHELSTAEYDLEVADEDGAAAAVELGESETQRSDTKAALDSLRTEIPAFVAAVAGAAEIADGVYSAIFEVASQRRAQIETLLTDDYAAFNALRLQYLEPAASVAGQLEGFSSHMESLPQMSIHDPYQHDGPMLEARAATEPVVLDPPTGPAVVAVELPDQLGCDPWGNEGCHYQWTAKFVESNWLDATITRIGARYRKGSYYCIVGGSEWNDVSVTVDANGDGTWSGALYVDRDDVCKPVIGGDLLVNWKGTDADGNGLSGRATADLENPG